MSEPAAQTLDRKRRRLGEVHPTGVANRAWAAPLRKFFDTSIVPSR